MKKRPSVADKLGYIERRVPLVNFYSSEAVAVAASLDPAKLDDRDRMVIGRVLQHLFDVLTDRPRELRDLHTINDALQALVPEWVPEPAPEPEPVTADCRHCRESFQPRRSDAVYCSARCRVAAKRIRDRSELAVTAAAMTREKE